MNIDCRNEKSSRVPALVVPALYRDKRNGEVILTCPDGWALVVRAANHAAEPKRNRRVGEFTKVVLVEDDEPFNGEVVFSNEG